MIKEYDVIKLRKSLPANNLKVGAEGTVLIVYNEPGLPRAYEVEFLSNDGKSLAVITLTDDDVEKVWSYTDK
jgi:hypothetical protein